MIVHRLRSFPEKYQNNSKDFSDYCDKMAVDGKAASIRELQVASDIFCSVIECYSIENFLVPQNTIWPLRISKISASTNILRLWVQGAHCMALVSTRS